jgi:carbamoyltransferase
MGRTKGPWILGISASHNGGACLLRGSEIVVAIQEERLTGFKRARIFGANESLSVTYCLKHAGLSAKDLDLVVVATQGRALSAKQDILRNPQLQITRNGLAVLTISHHLAHAASAYGLSGFKEAAVLVVDGLGSPIEDFSREERSVVLTRPTDAWDHISFYFAKGRVIQPIRKHVVTGDLWLRTRATGMPTFGSLGGMYSAVAQQIFGDPMEAGQVMGLAPYGRPIYRPTDFFTISRQSFVFHDLVPNRYRHNRRWPQCERIYKNLASSVQSALEVAITHLVAQLRRLCPSKNLCYAGGVALNGTVNETLHRSGLFRQIFVPPAAEDSGAAIGAAFYGLWQVNPKYQPKRHVSDALGKSYERRSIERAIRPMREIVRKVSTRRVIEETVERISAGLLCGWFQGGSEFGPRALGHRSILADPREIQIKERLNALVKKRASFRPFAPSILEEEASRFMIGTESEFSSPFMLRVCRLTPEAQALAPAISHVDGTARVHTVNPGSNPKLHALITAFARKTGVPILLNTSFNGKGEPIVETPDDALWSSCFLGLDFCVLQNTIVESRQILSPLDFYPLIKSPGYTIAIRFPTAHCERPLNADILLQLPTQWGPANEAISTADLAILRTIDGKINGWKLLKKLSARNEELTAAVVINSLLRLRRMSAIVLSRRP